MPIYHVTLDYDGDDLRSIARIMDDGDISLDEGLRMVADKWFDGDLHDATRYLNTDGHEVHCHATLAEAIRHRDDWNRDAMILEIDATGLDVYSGTEYPHPVVRDVIPADRVTVMWPWDTQSPHIKESVN